MGVVVVVAEEERKHRASAFDQKKLPKLYRNNSSGTTKSQLSFLATRIPFSTFLLTASLFLLATAQPANAQGAKPIVSAKNEVDENDLACAACLAIVDIVENEMVKKSFDGIEARLYDLFETICEQNNYRNYDFIPPKMTEGCKKFMDKNEDDDLVSAFQAFYANANSDNPRHRTLIERKICLNVSGDCIGNKRLEGKDQPNKLGDKTPDEDKLFDASVDDIMAKHGHKMKKPNPVKHDDEL